MCGQQRWTGWVNPASSYLSSNDPRVHFGLGKADRVDSIQVKWPDGTAETFSGRGANAFVEVRKGTGSK